MCVYVVFGDVGKEKLIFLKQLSSKILNSLKSGFSEWKLITHFVYFVFKWIPKAEKRSQRHFHWIWTFIVNGECGVCENTFSVLVCYLIRHSFNNCVEIRLFRELSVHHHHDHDHSSIKMYKHIGAGVEEILL